MIVRTPLIRSKKILAFAKGQPCTLRFHGICNGNPETTVAAHIRDQHKGMGIKASDYSVVFACSDCHRHLDEGYMGTAWDYVVRGLQETWGLLIAAGVIVVPQDPTPKPRRIRPKAQRDPSRPIPQRQNPWGPKGSRKFNYRNEVKP